jgi:hypothetical protein
MLDRVQNKEISNINYWQRHSENLLCLAFCRKNEAINFILCTGILKICLQETYIQNYKSERKAGKTPELHVFTSLFRKEYKIVT